MLAVVICTLRKVLEGNRKNSKYLEGKKCQKEWCAPFFTEFEFREKIVHTKIYIFPSYHLEDYRDEQYLMSRGNKTENYSVSCPHRDAFEYIKIKSTQKYSKVFKNSQNSLKVFRRTQKYSIVYSQIFESPHAGKYPKVLKTIQKDSKALKRSHKY